MSRCLLRWRGIVASGTIVAAMTEPEVTAEPTTTIASFRDLTEFVVAEIDSGRMWAGWSDGKFSYGELAQQAAPTEGFVAVDVTDREAVGVLTGAIASHLVALRAQASAPKPLNREQRRQVQKNAEKQAKQLWTPQVRGGQQRNPSAPAPPQATRIPSPPPPGI